MCSKGEDEDGIKVLEVDRALEMNLVMSAGVADSALIVSVCLSECLSEGVIEERSRTGLPTVLTLVNALLCSGSWIISCVRGVVFRRVF